MKTQEFEQFCKENFSQKRVLVTGADGFVAGYLLPLIHEAGAEILGIGLTQDARYIDFPYEACDLRDLFAVRETISKFKPDYVFHLASQSSVGTSWSSEWQTIESNVQTAHNLMRSVELLEKKVRVVAVSSGEVYGYVGDRQAKVTDPLKPQNPYAVSKAMMEVMLHRFQNTQLEFVVARSYSHTGAGRAPRFFEASVASQFAQAIDQHQTQVALEVGNLEVIRDYSDVREVVRKYIWLAVKGGSGETYNVCSGGGLPLSSIIHRLETLSGVTAVTHVDPSRLRRNDLPYLVGENSLKDVFPEEDYPIEGALRDLLSSFSKLYC